MSNDTNVISVYDYVDAVGKNVLPINLDQLTLTDSTLTCNVKAASFLPRKISDVIPLVQDGTINSVFSIVPFWIDNNSRQFYLEFIPSRAMIRVKKITADDVDESLSCAEERFDESSVTYDWERTVPYSRVDNILMVIFRAGGAQEIESA